MPEPINGDGTSFDNAPIAPSPTDTAAAGNLRTVLQKILNNTKFLYDRVFTTGVLAVRRVADVAALQALAGMSDRQVALVDRLGPFLFLSGDATPTVTNWIVAPNGGGGRWFHWMYLARNVASGIAALDAAGRIPAGLPANGIVLVDQATLQSGDYETSLNTNTDVPGVSLNVGTLAVGDRVLLTGIGNVAATDANANANLSLRVKIGGAASAFIPNCGYQQRGTGSPAYGPITIEHLFTATTAATHEFVFALSASASQSATLINGAKLRAVVIRP